MLQDFQTTARIEQLRAKARTGELTDDECAEVIKILRGNRSAAVSTVKPSKSHAVKAPPPSGDDLLKELGL
jgi:hypothetical protein